MPRKFIQVRHKDDFHKGVVKTLLKKKELNERAIDHIIKLGYVNDWDKGYIAALKTINSGIKAELNYYGGKAEFPF